MSTSSRRKFLKTTAIGSATAALGNPVMAAPKTKLTKANAMDHVILVLFENLSDSCF